MCYVSVPMLGTFRFLNSLVAGVMLLIYSKYSTSLWQASSPASHPNLRGLVTDVPTASAVDEIPSLPINAVSKQDVDDFKLATALSDQNPDQSTHHALTMASDNKKKSPSPYLRFGNKLAASVGNTILAFIIMIFNIVVGFFSGLFSL